MDPQPVQVYSPTVSRRPANTHPLVASVDQILDEVIDVASASSISQAFTFLSDQLCTFQTRKTVPVALISHDPQALTSSEVFSRIQDYAESKVRSLHTKVAYLHDLHSTKKTGKVMEMLATAFETASLMYLLDFETYFILIENLEAWDRHVISNVLATMHNVLQDGNIRVGVLVEVAGDLSVFRNSLDYNIIFGLDIHEIALKGFQQLKEMVFHMLISTEGFPALSSSLTQEIFSAPSFSDMRKQLKFQVIRHFTTANLLTNRRFNGMYECLRSLEDVSAHPTATVLRSVKSGWLQAIGKLNTLLLSMKVPTVSSVLDVYSKADYRDALPVSRLYGAFDSLGNSEEWENALANLEHTNHLVSEKVSLLFAECQRQRTSISPTDISRARDNLDLYLSNNEVLNTGLDTQEIASLRSCYAKFIEQNKGLSKTKQSRTDLLLNKPHNEDAKFDGFKRTALREAIRLLFELPLQHPEAVISKECPYNKAEILLEGSLSDGNVGVVSPFLRNSVDMVADVARHLFYPHVYMGGKRLEKQLNPDICLVFHLISQRGKKVDLSDVFDEYCGIIGRTDMNLSQ